MFCHRKSSIVNFFFFFGNSSFCVEAPRFWYRSSFIREKNNTYFLCVVVEIISAQCSFRNDIILYNNENAIKKKKNKN